MTSLKTHYSCAELAELKLLGLPVTKKGWIDLVAREDWQKQQRLGRGGGYEYQPPAPIMAIIKEKLLQNMMQQSIQEQSATILPTPAK